MKLTVIGAMRSCTDCNKESWEEIKNENMEGILEDLKRFSGAEGGICYMSKPFFDSYVTDPEKAFNRFGTVASTGHHSISGHAQVAMLLESVPKIIAMFLNNLHDYETSEKSGRYTVMTGNSEIEVELYEKWMEKLKDAIYKEYEDKIDERTRDKLAKENARYFLSVFTPTTFGYTASLRQWNYIIDWCDKYCKNEDIPDNYFFNTLKSYFTQLRAQLYDLLYTDELRDFKGIKGLDMINWNVRNTTEFQFGKMYNIGYKASFAEYAQAQRHRTLSYTMQFDGVSKEFYVPKIVESSGLADEWKDDMTKVAQYIPTGTLIYAEESGNIRDFYLKSMERNCGRAQLEIMNQNLATSRLFYENIHLFNKEDREFMMHFYKTDGEPKMKGQLLTCKEPCIWGCEDAKTRLI